MTLKQVRDLVHYIENVKVDKQDRIIPWISLDEFAELLRHERITHDNVTRPEKGAQDET